MGQHHVMLDLETFSNDVKDGAIFAMAGVRFYLDDEPGMFAPIEPPPEAYDAVRYGRFHREWMFQTVKLDSRLFHDMKIEADTLNWWLQPENMSNLLHLLSLPGALPIDEALNEMCEWTRYRNAAPIVWSHGASYDIAHIETKMRYLYGKDVPWTRQNIRDTRTVFALYKELFGKDVSWPERKRKHHPLEDAWAQAVAIYRAWTEIRTVAKHGLTIANTPLQI